jgi:hypothetical protein
MNETYRNLRERLDGTLQFLPDKPEETVDSTLHALWMTAAGTPMSAEAAADATLPELDAKARAMLDSLIDQRIAGIPLAHITGRQRFLDIARGDRAEELVLFADRALDLDLELRETVRDRLRVLRQLGVLGGDDLLLVLDLRHVARGGPCGLVLRDEEISPVTGTNLHDLARLAEVVDIFTEDDLHDVLSF